MANNTETPTWEAGVYEFDINDPIQGGPGGIDNLPHVQLGNRTLWLKAQVEALQKTNVVAAQSLGNISGATALDLSLYGYFQGTVTGSTTFSFTNPSAAANVAQGFVLEITNGGAAAITWPASVKWPGNIVPLLTASGTDVLVFVTDDAGVTWRARVSMLKSGG